MDFILTAIMLGVGLAMDAFSVSLANGLRNPSIQKSGRLRIAGAFSLFQFMMPMLGWFFVHTVALLFSALRPLIPWIGFFLLILVGGKMLWDGIGEEWKKHPAGEDIAEWERASGECSAQEVSNGLLLLQALATSIDALSVGFAFSNYSIAQAFGSSLIIAAVTMLISLSGIAIGRRIGMKLSVSAQIMGGVILILIGIWVVVR